MVTGEKKIEFRKPSQWIMSRLMAKQYDYVKFVNGYGKNKPSFTAIYKGWGIEETPKTMAYSNGLTFLSATGTVKIYIGRIVSTNNYFI